MFDFMDQNMSTFLLTEVLINIDCQYIQMILNCSEHFTANISAYLYNALKHIKKVSEYDVEISQSHADCEEWPSNDHRILTATRHQEDNKSKATSFLFSLWIPVKSTLVN